MNEKKRISEINMMEPGNPKNTNRLRRATRKSFGDKKLIPLTSVIKRVLKRRPIASTSKNELVESKAWLMSIQKADNINAACPLMTHIMSQCISTTVE